MLTGFAIQNKLEVSIFTHGPPGKALPMFLSSPSKQREITIFPSKQRFVKIYLLSRNREEEETTKITLQWHLSQ